MNLRLKNTVFLNFVALNKLVEQNLTKRSVLADSIGIDESTLRRWLNGKIKRVKYTNAVAAAEFFRRSSNKIAYFSYLLLFL